MDSIICRAIAYIFTALMNSKFQRVGYMLVGKRFLRNYSLLACIVISSSALAQQSAMDAFYEVTGVSVEKSPGTLVRVAEYSNSRLTGAASSRIMYLSVDALGQTVPATAAVAIPRGEPPKGGWPIIAWAPGTVGIGKKCAPSMTDNLSKYGPYLQGWIDRGYAIVAVDYSGLGSTGRHFYSHRESNARDVIEAVKAAIFSYPQLSRAFVAMGHSQGGLAAVGVAETIGNLDISPLQYKGAVAFAPSNGANHGYFRFVERAGVSEPTLLAYMLYYSATLKLATPGLQYSDQMSSEMEELMPAAEHQCLDELRTTLKSAVSFPKHFIKSSWVQHPALKKYSEKNQAGQRKTTGPLFIAWGTSDSSISKNMLDTIIQPSCRHGSDIQFSQYTGASHSTVLVQSRVDVAAWLGQQFSDNFKSPACGDAFKAS